jgi:hypothetical protein
MLDSGSANTWVGASTQYQRTGTSRATGEVIEINYDGDEIMDGATYNMIS